MIELRKGNLFTLYRSPCVIVHGANAQGVMGSGFAAQFKIDFPEAYLDYINHAKYTLGDLITTEYGDITVCSAITQKFYGRDKTHQYVDYAAVEIALDKVAAIAYGRPIYMPFIGGGLANGDREVLWEIFSEVFANSAAFIFTLD